MNYTSKSGWPFSRSYCTITQMASTHILCSSILFLVDEPCLKRCPNTLNDFSLVWKVSCLCLALVKNFLRPFDWVLFVMVTFDIPLYPESPTAFLPLGILKYKED